ncbi:MAG TPA: hypothetical protein VGP47_06440, partial [Parachlamydiaceae bacterium]|nr:hypothetical protein [Parachlamydiaceae bacterium]
MTYNPEWAKEPYKTGVVFPYYNNEVENEVYYLVGKDVKAKDKAVRDNDWSAFGGFRKPNEYIPLETAIRELVEESLVLGDLAVSLRNKKAVKFSHSMNHIFIINLYPENEKDHCYSVEQINAICTSFLELRPKVLEADQKEKYQLGWMKASEIAEKVFSSSPCFTIYEKPSKSSFTLDLNANLRKCHQYFLKDVINNTEKNSNNNIKTGWAGLEGQECIVQHKNNFNCISTKNQFKEQDNSPLKPLDELNNKENCLITIIQNSGGKPWDKNILQANSPGILTHSKANFSAPIPKRRPWDQSVLPDIISTKSTVNSSCKNSTNLSNWMVQRLIQRWYNAASIQDLKPTERLKLYEDTEQLVISLTNLSSDHGEVAKEKVAQMCNIIIQEFQKHGIGESEQLAIWIARNNSSESGSIKDIKCNPLHHLFSFVAVIKECHDVFNVDFDNMENKDIYFSQLWKLASLVHI